MISRPGAANELREFGRFYVMYNTERNKSPSKLEDLKPYMERDAKTLLEAIKDGYYVVVWNVRELSSNTLLAYEKTPDGNGDHLVVMGDGSVSKLNDQQLQKSLKGQ